MKISSIQECTVYKTVDGKIFDDKERAKSYTLDKIGEELSAILSFLEPKIMEYWKTKSYCRINWIVGDIIDNDLLHSINKVLNKYL